MSHKQQLSYSSSSLLCVLTIMVHTSRSNSSFIIHLNLLRLQKLIRTFMRQDLILACALMHSARRNACTMSDTITGLKYSNEFNKISKTFTVTQCRATNDCNTN